MIDCFCKAEYKVHGKDVRTNVYVDSENQSAEICHEWYYDTYLAKMYNYAISGSINAINFVLRTVLIRLIAFIGEDTRSA